MLAVLPSSILAAGGYRHAAIGAGNYFLCLACSKASLQASSHRVRGPWTGDCRVLVGSYTSLVLPWCCPGTCTKGRLLRAPVCMPPLYLSHAEGDAPGKTQEASQRASRTAVTLLTSTRWTCRLSALVPDGRSSACPPFALLLGFACSQSPLPCPVLQRIVLHEFHTGCRPAKPQRTVTPRKSAVDWSILRERLRGCYLI